MPRQKLRYIMFGVCSNCGREFTRSPDVDTAVCDCTNAPREVSLKPVMLFRPSRILQKLQDVCPTSVSLEKFVNTLLKVALDHVSQNPAELQRMVKASKKEL